MKKKIAFACDHRGFVIKDEIFKILDNLNCEVIDCGTHSAESSDYPDFIFAAAEKVAKGACERAIGVCYTGIGSAIAANKVPGVRAALVHSLKEAELSRAHNDANMLIVGAGFTAVEILPQLIKTWLTTPFEGGRHVRRLDKIKGYEQKHCK